MVLAVRAGKHYLVVGVAESRVRVRTWDWDGHVFVEQSASVVDIHWNQSSAMADTVDSDILVVLVSLL